MDQASEFPELLRAAQQGDEAAFVQLFRTVQPRLLRYLSVVAGPLAEDVAADTWVSVVRDLAHFTGDDPAGFRAWVLSIARRRWVDEVRRRARRPEVPTADLPDTATAADVAEQVAETDQAARIMTLVQGLPPDQAEVIALRVVMGLDVTATAEAVGKTPGAVRVLAHRGLRRLAVLLQETDSTPHPVGVTPQPAATIFGKGGG